MGHSHGHNHRHSHANNYNKAFAIGICLNIAFVVIEIFYGLIANSSALLADAGHNASDVLVWFLPDLQYGCQPKNLKDVILMDLRKQLF